MTSFNADDLLVATESRPPHEDSVQILDAMRKHEPFVSALIIDTIRDIAKMKDPYESIYALCGVMLHLGALARDAALERDSKAVVQ